MSEDIVVRQCAPTLAGLKTGSLFPCPYESKQTLMKDVRKLNQNPRTQGAVSAALAPG